MGREKGTITTMNSTSRCSSRCPSRCAIHYGYRVWTFPYLFFQRTPRGGGGKKEGRAKNSRGDPPRKTVSNPLTQKRSGDPNPQYFAKSTAVQMGGVLPYKWEAHCRVSLSSKLRSQESTAIQMGGVLPYKWEVYCRTFQTGCRGWGFRKIAHHQEPRKGGFSRGGFCTIQCTPKKLRMPQNIGHSSTFGTQSATAKRGVDVYENPLLKTPFSWFLTSPRYVLPPTSAISLSKSLRTSRNFPQLTSETAFGGSRKMLSDGPPLRGFTFRCVLPL